MSENIKNYEIEAARQRIMRIRQNQTEPSTKEVKIVSDFVNMVREQTLIDVLAELHLLREELRELVDTMMLLLEKENKTLELEYETLTNLNDYLRKELKRG